MSEIIPTPKSRRFKDLTGQRFERLTVLGYVGRISNSSHWLCRCACGAEKVVSSGGLQGGQTKSCGCFRAERMGSLTFKHGGRSRARPQKRPEYKAWEQMRNRCVDASHKQWRWYGGKGIKVHPEWERDFEAFLAHVGPRPSNKHSLDRIQSGGNYEPGNVRWATWTEQARNRSSNRIVEFSGKSMTMIEAAELAGIPYKTVKSRIGHGWSVEEALTRPPNPNKVNAARRNTRKT